MVARERDPGHPCLRRRWYRGTTYEAAWVMPLGAAAAAHIDALRAELAVPAPPEGVLLPHLTILYLGRGTGAWISRLCGALAELPFHPVDMVLAAWGHFGDGATIRNLHLRPLDAGPLASLHLAARERCLRLGWADPSAWSGPRYVPHVSLFDGIATSADVLGRLPRVRVSDRLASCAALGRRIGGSP